MKEEYQINVDEGGIKRIKNAATRINKPIYLVGSRAVGNSRYDSDFDYVIPTINSKEWDKIKNSLPGAKNTSEKLCNRVDLIKSEIDIARPHIKIYPQLKTNNKDAN